MKTRKTIKDQILEAVTPDTRAHTEDCLDANDDTSVLKGKCICPKPSPAPTPDLNYETPLRVEYDLAYEMYTLRDYTGSIIARIRANDLELPAFIVKAVNAYERDQQIKEELLTFVKNIRPFLGHDPEATLHKQADSLIAKAALAESVSENDVKGKSNV